PSSVDAGDRAMIDRLFVYGTLQRDGGANHLLLAHAVLEPPRAAEVCGELLDLGEYPALVLPGMAGVAGGRVYGELWRFAAIDEVFVELDPYEDFHGHDPEALARSLYRREVIDVFVQGPESAPRGRCAAWAYVWNGPLEQARVAGGRWLTR
ncbi:MAG: gamma-glutamylcyclotransferase, partial [Myxococcales bacterium]|nr:gamma-glutamylcyclotransferase [Myxococcales bacterium]